MYNNNNNKIAVETMIYVVQENCVANKGVYVMCVHHVHITFLDVCQLTQTTFSIHLYTYVFLLCPIFHTSLSCISRVQWIIRLENPWFISHPSALSHHQEFGWCSAASSSTVTYNYSVCMYRYVCVKLHRYA